MSGACQYRDVLRGSNRATELSSCGLSSFSRLCRRVSILANKRGAPSLKMPSCVARAVLWLASDAASFVVGHNLCVGGGFLAS
jgi:NAD(P)-dependent dehydrogenase (short-subunit alcohol dehydrogenase family)